MDIRIFLYLIIILSAIFHEYAHGWMAYRLGDSTAKDAGRLTLNPIVHLDLVGTVILPLFLLFTWGGFLGWAKPVPYNPNNLRDQRYGSLKVALAGPGVNLLIALVLGLILRFLIGSASVSINLALMQFLTYLGLIVYINIFLALFNLIPLPPLDGSKILADLLPNKWLHLMRFGFGGIFLALFVAFTLLTPLARLIFGLITGQSFNL